MSLIARIGVVVVLVAGALLFLFALQMDPAEESNSPRTTQDPPGTQTTTAKMGPEAKPGTLDSPENCRRCHEEIYKEWLSDRHSKAWVGEIYTELSKNHTDSTCWSCHAPRPILETGAPAEVRANYRERGITCLTCHQRGNHVVGPIRNPDQDPAVAECGPIHDASFPSADNQKATNEFCGSCHNLHGTCDEFMGSKYAREGQTCLSCHMEEVVGPVVTGGEPRARRSHRMPGGHSPEMLKKAMRIEARIGEGRIFARVFNQGAGHRVPTDARHRGIRLFAEFFDAYGHPVPVAHGQNRPRRQVQLDLIRLFYRWEHKEPTQIDPAGTLGKDNWRESSIEIPPEAQGGRVRLTLYYLLRHDWPPRKGTLVAEQELSLE